MQKSTDGAPRSHEPARSARTRRSLAARLNRRSVAAVRATQAWMHGHAAAPSRAMRASLATALRPFATAERGLPVAVAAIVAVASLLALLPGTPAGTASGVQAEDRAVRLAVNGGVARSFSADAAVLPDVQAIPAESFRPIVLPDEDAMPAVALQSDPGSLLADGTLVTGYAPETTVEDGADLITKYKVQSGDTLSGIAHKFGVSVMTLWWANKLKAKDDLHVGQTLRIPPVNGIVVTVKDTDTLESLAAAYKVDQSRIVTVNDLADSTLVVGQVLVVPGARGEPIPTPKPTPAPKPKAKAKVAAAPHRVSSRSSGATHYSGGRMRWPVVGGGNYVSQYFHSGHGAIDIAADYGASVVAAAGGRVQFAGWKSNGGGWQVWISHGSGLYTTYNHMSSLAVRTGQFVGKGQRVGRIGASGWATGPHLHFEVWKGPIWNGGHQVNPMSYL